MVKDKLKDILNNLLLISDRIIKQEELLIQCANNTNPLLFKTAITLLCSALNEEKEIINLLSIDDLRNIEAMLFDIESDTKKKSSYERLHTVITDMVTDYNNNNDIVLDDDIEDTLDEDIEEDIEEATDEFDVNFEDDDIIFRSDYYNKNERYIKKYINPIIRRTTIIVLKKIRSRITNLGFPNSKENKYMQLLLQYLNEFKYKKVFQDYFLENLASQYSFNLDNIPTPSLPEEDTSPIMFNQCINFLEDLYFVDTNERNIEVIMEALFKLMCVEEYIEELSNEDLDKLLEFCYKAAKQNDDENFGMSAEGLIRRRKNDNI